MSMSLGSLTWKNDSSAEGAQQKIRGKEVMAILVNAPLTVDDADATELYTLEKQFKIIFEGDSDIF